MRLPLTFVLVLLFSACAQSATEVPLLPVDNEPMTDILIPPDYHAIHGVEPERCHTGVAARQCRTAYVGNQARI